MNIRDDLVRLYKIYLDTITKLKQALPSDNVEHRTYDL